MTVWERADAYLRGIPQLYRLTQKDTWPFEATQDGIAHAVGVSRAHIALELKRHIGQVERTLAHVRGSNGVRRFVYRLTLPGVPALDPTNGNGHRSNATAVLRCPKCGTTLGVHFVAP